MVGNGDGGLVIFLVTFALELEFLGRAVAFTFVVFILEFVFVFVVSFARFQRCKGASVAFKWMGAARGIGVELEFEFKLKAVAAIDLATTAESVSDGSDASTLFSTVMEMTTRKKTIVPSRRTHPRGIRPEEDLSLIGNTRASWPFPQRFVSGQACVCTWLVLSVDDSHQRVPMDRSLVL